MKVTQRPMERNDTALESSLCSNKTAKVLVLHKASKIPVRLLVVCYGLIREPNGVPSQVRRQALTQGTDEEVHQNARKDHAEIG
jgi:hypothetical protein